MIFVKWFSEAALLRDDEFCYVEDYLSVPRAAIFDKQTCKRWKLITWILRSVKKKLDFATSTLLETRISVYGTRPTH